MNKFVQFYMFVMDSIMVFLKALTNISKRQVKQDQVFCDKKSEDNEILWNWFIEKTLAVYTISLKVKMHFECPFVPVYIDKDRA